MANPATFNVEKQLICASNGYTPNVDIISSMRLVKEFTKERIAARIDDAISEVKLTNDEVAQRMIDGYGIKSIKGESIRRYRTGDQWAVADPEKLIALCKVIRRSVSWVLFGEDGAKQDYTKNAIEAQLLHFYRNLSEDSQDELIGRANKLYVEQHPNDRSASPYNGIERRSSQESIDFEGRRAEDVLPTPTTGGSVRGKRDGKKGDSK